MTFDFDRFAEAKTFTAEVGGQQYVLRRFNSLMALKVYGSKALGLVQAESAPAKAPSDEETLKTVRELLAEAMVSPRLAPAGSPTNQKLGVVSFEDMGDDAFELVARIKDSGRGGEGADFPDSSPAPTAS